MDNRARVFGLMVGCPFSNPKDGCILNQYRHLPYKNMFDTIEKRDEEEIDRILFHHYDCSNKRVNKKKREG